MSDIARIPSPRLEVRDLRVANQEMAGVIAGLRAGIWKIAEPRSIRAVWAASQASGSFTQCTHDG